MYETIDRKFELFDHDFLFDAPTSIATVSIQLGTVAMNFADVKRVPRLANGERESDVEHSYMLALVAPEIADMLELGLDHGLICQYAVVHDLVELKTADYATFIISESELKAKHEREQDALMELRCELPPHTLRLLERYEAQLDEEARFVKLIDKLLPIVIDIIGQGDRVMKEDYDVHSLQELEVAHMRLRERIVSSFGSEFPTIVLAHELLTKMYEDMYGRTEH